MTMSGKGQEVWENEVNMHVENQLSKSLYSDWLLVCWQASLARCTCGKSTSFQDNCVFPHHNILLRNLTTLHAPSVLTSYVLAFATVELAKDTISGPVTLHPGTVKDPEDTMGWQDFGMP